MNEFLKNLRSENNLESQQKTTSEELYKYKIRDERIKKARILRIVANGLETQCLKASDRQWDMIDILIDELYRGKPEAKEDEEEQK